MRLFCTFVYFLKILWKFTRLRKVFTVILIVYKEPMPIVNECKFGKVILVGPSSGIISVQRLLPLNPRLSINPFGLPETM
ncbi:hypothetical protein QVD17_36022 [Tagetes erecta]|uniref:Uncharacterized protein n=1 Tax=Tagetes erecta TaxID=13708 RepID=A0AAD8JVI4_TARER|nr:hypothetical protein QVD17_36022 [Tagetes erecta]